MVIIAQCSNRRTGLLKDLHFFGDAKGSIWAGPAATIHAYHNLNSIPMPSDPQPRPQPRSMVFICELSMV